MRKMVPKTSPVAGSKRGSTKMRVISRRLMAAIPASETSSLEATPIGCSSSSVPMAAAKSTAALLEVKKNPCGRRHHMSWPLWVRYQTRSGKRETKSGSSGWAMRSGDTRLGNARGPGQSFERGGEERAGDGQRLFARRLQDEVIIGDD